MSAREPQAALPPVDHYASGVGIEDKKAAARRNLDAEKAVAKAHQQATEASHESLRDLVRAFLAAGQDPVPWRALAAELGLHDSTLRWLTRDIVEAHRKRRRARA